MVNAQDETPIQEPEYVPDVVLVSLEEGITLFSSPSATPGKRVTTDSDSVNSTLASLNVNSAKPVFPPGQAKKASRLSGERIKLASIYNLKLEPGSDVPSAVHALSQTNGVIFAEPDYIAYAADVQAVHARQLTIDDPLFSEQWGMEKINIAGAWDDTYGAPTITIAMIDSGIDTIHIDLADNLWLNPGEVAGNGLDDDNNGFIDDINGWNFVYANNSVGDDNGHGTLMAGVAAAIGGNGAGIAGVCPQCTIMPVKVMQASGAANYSDIANGVLYAAQKGAEVINLSLGGYADSNTLRNAINAAADTYGAVLVAGTGNDNLNQLFYPAAYDNVLAVAGTQSDDSKASFSNYGAWVDVSAPGVNIRTTALGGDWVDNSGTSVSAPFASGLAGLLWVMHPTWNQATIRSQIVHTTDAIDSANPSYSGLLGSGRLNAGSAMQDPYPLLTMTGYAINGLTNGRLSLGASAALNITLTNDWWDAPSVTGTISTSDTYVTLVDATASFGDIAANTSQTNTTPFSFIVDNSAGYNHAIAFTLDITDTNGHTDSFDFTLLTETGIEEKTGTISADETWTNDKTYLITNNVNVPIDKTLTIQPGTTVKFNSGCSLNVRGTLIADGTAAQPIQFQSNSTDSWGQLLFDNDSVDAVADEEGSYLSGSILRHVNITNGGHISCNGATPYLAHVNLENDIFCTPGATPLWLMDNTFTNESIGVRYIRIFGTGQAYRNTFISESLWMDSGSAIGNTITSGGLSIGGSGGSIQDNIVTGGNVSAGSACTVANNTISGSLTAGNGCSVEHNTAGGEINVGSDASVTWNTVENLPYVGYLGIGLSAGANVTAQYNRLIGNYIGMIATSGLIEHNLIANNSNVGLKVGAATVRYNTLTGNKGHTILVEGGNPLTIEHNNLEANKGTYDIYVNSGGEYLFAENNWWGTSSDAEIDERIFDWHENDTSAQVIYTPKLREPEQSAPAYVRGVAVLPDSTLGIQTGTFEVEFSQTMDSSHTPELEFFSHTPIQISTRQAVACALIKINGRILCWGHEPYGGTNGPPETYTQVSAGTEHVCGLKSDGNIVCWGSCVNGACDVPVGNYTQVSTGSQFACGLKSNGNIVCWGSCSLGNCDVPSGTYTQVSTGDQYTCGLKSDGSLACWGRNDFGQLNVPTGSYTQVSAGYTFACGLKSNGSLTCWGGNIYGQCNVPPGSYIQVSAGAYHTCGLKSDGNIACWGACGGGACDTPAGSYTQVSAGNDRTCGSKSDGSLLCWKCSSDDGVCGIPFELKHPELYEGYPITDNANFSSPNRFSATYDFNSAVPKDTYWLAVRDAVGADSMRTAPVAISTFSVDYAGAITDITPPLKPAVTASGDGGLTTLSADWVSRDPESNITKYRYAIGTTRGGRDVVDWTYSDNPFMTHSGLTLTAGVTYYVSVGARNEGGLWSVSGVSNGILAGTAPPASFGKGYPSNAASNLPANLTLKWGTSSSAVIYEYCIDKTNDNLCNTGWKSTGASTSAALSGLTSAKYFWQVRAKNEGGYTYANELSPAGTLPDDADSVVETDISLSGSGTWWSFTVPPKPGAFNKTSPSNAAINISANPTLKWGLSSNAASYEYCIDKSNDNQCGTGWISADTSTSKTLSGLTPAKYFWQVRAKNVKGITLANRGAWWSFTVPLRKPAAFSKTSPSNTATNQPAKSTLKWATSTGATSYEYCIDKTNDKQCSTTWKSTGSRTSAALTGLSPARYYWQVRAKNVKGTTLANWGAWWSFTVPPKPSAFSKYSPSNNAVNLPENPTLRWRTSSNAVIYEYCIDKTNDSKCGTGWKSTGTSTSVTLSGLTPAKYYWQVRARNATGTITANSGIWWSFKVLPKPAAFSKTSPSNGATNILPDPTLSWETSSGTEEYEYCIDTSNDTICDTGWISSGITPSAALTDLAPNTYFWQVRAKNAAGTIMANSGTWWSFTVPPKPDSFSKTSPVNTASDIPLDSILSWETSSGAEEYEYCIDTSNDTTCDTGWISSGITPSASPTGLVIATYYWQVRAKNVSGSTFANDGSWWSFTTAVP